MAIQIKNTNNMENKPHKVILYAHAGWGKTYQCRHFAEKYGKGLVLSGEDGLKSIEGADIDFIEFGPFQRREGVSPPSDMNDKRPTFREVVVYLMANYAEISKTYKWICIDSLTEVATRKVRYLEHEDRAKGVSKKESTLWQTYANDMANMFDWLRGLEMHVFLTCLARSDEDANGVNHYFPMVPGNQVKNKIMGVFDHVFAGHIVTHETEGEQPSVDRFVITTHARGFIAKCRDSSGTVQAIEKTDNITDILDKADRKPPTKTKAKDVKTKNAEIAEVADEQKADEKSAKDEENAKSE